MDRAATNKEPNIYTMAVNGGRPDGHKGRQHHLGLAPHLEDHARRPPLPTANDPAHKEFVRLFHQARYNAAWCAYQQAMGQTTKEDREKLLKQADYAITITRSTRPTWAATNGSRSTTN